MGKKNRNVNDKPAFLLTIGSLFAVIGIALVVAYFVVPKFPVLVIVVGAIFSAVGIFIVIFGIFRARAVKKHNELLKDENAYVTEATFIKSKFSSYQGSGVSVGLVTAPITADIYKKIIYSYTDENGVYHEVKSIMSFVPKQAQFLKEKGTFKIKCKGKISAVIEELPDINAHYNI